jgi:hypothetical protein
MNKFIVLLFLFSIFVPSHADPIPPNKHSGRTLHSRQTQRKAPLGCKGGVNHCRWIHHQQRVVWGAAILWQGCETFCFALTINYILTNEVNYFIKVYFKTEFYYIMH